ncbi:putative SWEET sugar transporter [Helianthus annuus]|uniref:Bidirectional sugar transporter SWEET n=1 Tax=Helianthus annuus TaxID=4232 RepID=A0A251SP01_HELAN|nr:bidirectional sugar transporter SWEET3 [Helianthus annuus]KAF5772270.1 putative SWEET sugar transporter [Helianthus annuus]KAJ0479932.1 putative SWEET sugar transporter [Helianthus annuus]KAJ0496701.1 putative SWEET sugar transporter [Helianthus annuus]KAJ0848115.1 putative SWEET sugar transporter [Helianthus annuus]
MIVILRMAVGLMGNAASFLLYAAPISTFARVIRKKSTEEFSYVPYTIALLNCLFYTWYGLPVVSYKWENFPMITINGLGIFLEFSFIVIFIWFASPKQKWKAGIMTTALIIFFSIIALISTYKFHDHKTRKQLVGGVGLIASVAMYASPLVVMKKVIQTKSVEFMPFSLSLFSFLASVLWMAYGLLGRDLLITAPNLVGAPLGALQLVLYCKYRNRVTVEPKPAQEWDVEKVDMKISKQHMQTAEVVTTDDNINEKKSSQKINS